MKLLLMGAPGSGKGTQGHIISEIYNIPVLSTGDLLRAKAKSGTPQGDALAETMRSGGYVSDDIMLSLVGEWCSTHKQGYILDGFPRTVVQLEGMFERGIEFEQVIYLTVDEQEIIDRVTGRMLHQPSGRVYHEKNFPPKVEGKDDLTGEDLVKREDDREEAVRTRLETYKELTLPILKALKEESSAKGYAFNELDGMTSPKEVQNAIKAILKK